jgi:hypothetical protein
MEGGISTPDDDVAREAAEGQTEHDEEAEAGEGETEEDEEAAHFSLQFTVAPGAPVPGDSSGARGAGADYRRSIPAKK